MVLTVKVIKKFSKRELLHSLPKIQPSAWHDEANLRTEFRTILITPSYVKNNFEKVRTLFAGMAYLGSLRGAMAFGLRGWWIKGA